VSPNKQCKSDDPPVTAIKNEFETKFTNQTCEIDVDCRLDDTAVFALSLSAGESLDVLVESKSSATSSNLPGPCVF
jgi:hypothetical protein